MSPRTLLRLIPAALALLLLAAFFTETFGLLTAQIRSADQALSRRDQTLTNHEKQIRALRAECDALAARLVQSETARKELEEKTDPALHDRLRTEIARLSEINLRLEAEKQTIREETDRLRRLLDETETARRQLDGALAAASNEIARLRQSEQNFRERLASTERERDAARTETAQIRNELGRTQESVRNLERRLTEEEQQRRQAENRTSLLEKRLADLEEELRTLRKPAAAP